MPSLGDARIAVARAGPWTLAKRVWHEVNDDKIFVWASALAYAWLFAIFPFFIFLLSLTPYLPERLKDKAEIEVRKALFETLPESAATTLWDNVEATLRQPQQGLLGLGLLVALWTASAGMQQTLRALERCYEVRQTRPFYIGRPVAIGMTIFVAVQALLVLALLPAAGIALTVARRYLDIPVGTLIALNVARWGLSLLLMFCVVGVVYHFGPRIRQRFRLITPGAIFVVAVWVVLGLGFRMYIDLYGAGGINRTYGTVGGVAMVYPFLIMLTGSLANGFDYDRRSPVPRHLWSREDRFMRTLSTFFPAAYRGSLGQLRSSFSGLPEDWQMWSQMGDDRDGTDRWAARHLAELRDPASRARLEAAACDYRDFASQCDLRETILAYDPRLVGPFLRRKYGSLESFNAAWEMAVEDFSQVQAVEWSGEPIDQASYVPEDDTRYRDLLAFRQAYREHRFAGFLKSPTAYVNFLRPAGLRHVWEEYAVRTELAKPAEAYDLPYPVPADAAPAVRKAWEEFLAQYFPLRHIEIAVTPERQAQFTAFARDRFRNLEYLNNVLETDFRDWSELALTPTVPGIKTVKVWMDFVRTKVPVAEWTVRETLPEKAFQTFALKRHGSLEKINAAYGRKLERPEQLKLPFREAFLLTFDAHDRDFAWAQCSGNYGAVFDHLFYRGKAVRNTIVLVVLTVLLTLLVNPLAGYALSRFRLRLTEKIIVFCLATMAFPAAVSAIPGFLLLRDLGFLNTFMALVLPGAANGMTIFLLKGFFDSLPRELYEAAAIDGASERTVFFRISLPLVKPILAVSMLHAFIAAYSGWEWALVVCQDREMWTVAVWTYQFYQSFGAYPYVTMAAFVLTSIPVMAVFLFCQRVILRGIVLPEMK